MGSSMNVLVIAVFPICKKNNFVYWWNIHNILCGTRISAYLPNHGTLVLHKSLIHTNQLTHHYLQCFHLSNNFFIFYIYLKLNICMVHILNFEPGCMSFQRLWLYKKKKREMGTLGIPKQSREFGKFAMLFLCCIFF